MNEKKNNMMVKDSAELVKLFSVALRTNNSSDSKSDFSKVNNFACKLGYIVHPDACTSTVMSFLREEERTKADYNSTFYKTWADVTSKSRWELFVDQMLHYITTYGSNHTQEGNGYVPNDRTEELHFDYSKYKVIMPCTEEELFERCETMVKSGIALKQETNNAVCAYITDYVKAYNIIEDFDIDSVKNREAVVILCDSLGIKPKNEFNLIRYIVYRTTGDSMIINNREMFAKIKNSATPFDFGTLSDDELITLSKIFFRYKDVILAFKHNYSIKHIRSHNYAINAIRRYANKYHTPMKVGVWERLVNDCKNGNVNFDEIKEKAKDLNNFKIVTLLQTLLETAQEIDPKFKMYIIRNGKVFYKMNKKKGSYYDGDETNGYVAMVKSNLACVYAILKIQLVENLKSKACKVKFNKEINLSCPTSEKNFIGNIPFGSYFDIKDHNYFGIYWRGEWGTQDFDLSFNDITGNRIGWNSRYTDAVNSLIYSGDMTSANPCASELLYMKKGCPNGVIYVNRYCGNEGSKFKFMFGQEDIKSEKFVRNYMVDPNSIKVETMCVSDKREKQIGIVCDNRTYICELSSGNGRVASTYITAEDIYKNMCKKAKSFVMLNDILLEAGFVEYVNDEVSGEFTDKDLDLTDLNKDTLISLFA